MRYSNRILIPLILLFGLSLIACSGETTPSIVLPTEAEATPQLEEATVSVPTTLPAATPSPTLTAPLAILLAPPGSDAALEVSLSTGMQAALAEAGLRWEVRNSLNAAEMTSDVRLVVVISPDPGLAELLAAAPQTQFLAIGLPGLQPGANLSLVGATGYRPDRAGFIAGMTAAVVTPDWRVAVLGPGDLPADRAARYGFLNGAVYVCGLCLPYFGPSVDYPVSVELSPEADSAAVQAAIQQLQNQAVKTVYLPPAIAEIQFVEALAQAGFNIIGSYGAPTELFNHWIATVEPDPVSAALEMLPRLLAGEGGLSREMPYALVDVNPNLLSEGRRLYLEELIAEVMAGYLDTGIDPLTGNPR